MRALRLQAPKKQYWRGEVLTSMPVTNSYNIPHAKTPTGRHNYRNECARFWPNRKHKHWAGGPGCEARESRASQTTNPEARSAHRKSRIPLYTYNHIGRVEVWVVCHAKDSTRRQPAEVAPARRGPRARGVDVVKDRTRLDAPTTHIANSVQGDVQGGSARGGALAEAMA